MDNYFVAPVLVFFVVVVLVVFLMWQKNLLKLKRHLLESGHTERRNTQMCSVE